MLRSLKRVGGSLVITVPKAFIQQNNLHEGSKVNLMLKGELLTITATKTNRKRYKLEDLLAEMPNGLPYDKEWDEMQPVGREII
jgi:antitoxin ChpS